MRLSLFIFAAIFSTLLTGNSIAQQSDGSRAKQLADAVPGPTGITPAPANSSSENKSTELSERERMLLERIERLEQRLAELESRDATRRTESDSVSKSGATTWSASTAGDPAKEAGSSQPATLGSSTSASAPAPMPRANGIVAQDPRAGSTQAKKKPEPFSFADFTWMTGNPRTKESPIDTPYFTGEFRSDVAFHESFNHPRDDTISGSGEVFRSGEAQLTHLAIGGDFHWDHLRGRVLTQIGMYSQTQPRNDVSPSRGQWQLDNAYRYVSEAYGGYHIDELNGINIDAGIFLSYIGLWSFYNFDNWTYQPSFVSSNTPWFFEGLRIHSIQVKYLDKPGNALSKAAFSFTFDAGCEYGRDSGVSCTGGTLDKPSQYFVGFMAYNRFWFHNDKFGLTLGGGAITNPGRYLVLLPPINGATAFSGTPYFTANPGDRFKGLDGSITFDYMPTQFTTFRGKYNYRTSNVPYYSGPGGVTPPGGNQGPPGSFVPGFTPDLLKYERRSTIALLVKL